MTGVFVTGTDTGAGKTVVAAAICAALTARGLKVAPFKPVVTGLDDAGPDTLLPDHELLAACAGTHPALVAPEVFGPPASPHLAAALAGRELDPDVLLAAAREAGAQADVLVAEGVGGLLVPLTPTVTIRDFAAALGLPLVVAARPGLGTINHTRLTVESARTAGLDVRAAVLGPWPEDPDAVLRSNLETLAADVPVCTLPEVELTVEALATAGAALPLDDWLG